jgi:hypothetical protein
MSKADTEPEVIYLKVSSPLLFVLMDAEFVFGQTFLE